MTITKQYGDFTVTAEDIEVQNWTPWWEDETYQEYEDGVLVSVYDRNGELIDDAFYSAYESPSHYFAEIEKEGEFFI